MVYSLCRFPQWKSSILNCSVCSQTKEMCNTLCFTHLLQTAVETGVWRQTSNDAVYCTHSDLTGGVWVLWRTLNLLCVWVHIPLFLLKERIMFAVVPIQQWTLFEICSSFDALLISKKLKYGETILYSFSDTFHTVSWKIFCFKVYSIPTNKRSICYSATCGCGRLNWTV